MDITDLPWFTTDNETYLAIQTDDISFDGTLYYVTQHMSYEDLYFEVDVMTVTIGDPCWNTSFVTQNMPAMEQFVDITAEYPVQKLIVELPILDDVINKLFGSDPENSICGS